MLPMFANTAGAVFFACFSDNDGFPKKAKNKALENFLSTAFSASGNLVIAQ
jgi:hypothetical protein